MQATIFSSPSTTSAVTCRRQPRPPRHPQDFPQWRQQVRNKCVYTCLMLLSNQIFEQHKVEWGGGDNGVWQWVARVKHPTRFPRRSSIWSSGSCCSYLSGDCKLLFAKFVHIYILSCPVGYAWLPLMDSNGRYLHTKLLLASSTMKIYFMYSCMRPHFQSTGERGNEVNIC